MIRPWFLLVALLVGASGLEAADEVLIRGGTIVPAAGEDARTADLWLRDGLIHAIGTDLEVPPGARVLDATGLTIYPGFIDGATTAGLSEMKYAAGPVEGAGIDHRRAAPARTEITRKGISPDLLAADFLSIDLDLAKKQHEAGFTASLVAPDDGIVAGQGVLVSLSGAPRRSAILAPSVGMYGGLSARGRGYPSTLMGSTAHFRQLLLDADRHRKIRANYDARPSGLPRPPYDPALTALEPVLSGERPLILRATSPLAIERSLRLSNEFGFRLVVTGGQEAGEMAEELARRSVPVLLDLDFPKEPDKPKEPKKKAKEEGAPDAEDDAEDPEEIEDAESASDESKGDAPAEKDDEKRDEKSEETQAERPWSDLPVKERFAKPRRAIEAEHAEWAKRLETAAALEKAGVTFAFASGGKPNRVLDGIEKLIEHGLSPAGALRALTLTPAQFCGVSDRLGTIEPGKIAHLTILNGELGSSKNSVAYVFVDGQEFEVKGRKKAKEKKAESKDENSPTEAAASGPARLEGKWNVEQISERGTFELQWVIRKEGSAYTGAMETRFGEGKLLEAKLSGTDATLVFEMAFGDETFEWTFKGKISGSSMKGTASTTRGDREFTAERTGNPEGSER